MSGYDPRLERVAELMDESVNLMRDAPITYSAPRKHSIASWYIKENQGQMGRCAGEGTAGTGETSHYVETGGKVIQFNAYVQYRLAQDEDGITGDNGSTIAGNVKVAKEIGLCPNDVWSEPSVYGTPIPQEALDACEKYKMRNHQYLGSVGEVESFLKLGLGGVLVGGAWGYWGADSDGICRRFRGGGGGHAWFISGWDDDADNGRGTFEWWNSHNDGRGELSKGFVQTMLQDRWTVMVGLSKLTAPKPDAWDWLSGPTFA